MIENIESDFFFFMSNHKQKNNIHVTIPYNLHFQQDELYNFFFNKRGNWSLQFKLNRVLNSLMINDERKARNKINNKSSNHDSY
jgi:hypothetical protein